MPWNVDSDAQIDPPIHVENLRSGGAVTFTFMVEGHSVLISNCRRSLSPSKHDEPPHRTMLE